MELGKDMELEGDDQGKNQSSVDSLATNPPSDLNGTSSRTGSDDTETCTTEASTSGDTHYRPKDDALLRMEIMTFKEVRVLNFCMWIGLWIAFASLIWLFIEKVMNSMVAVQHLRFAWTNVTVGSLCFTCVTAALIAHCLRIYYNRKKHWTRMRGQFTIFILLELCSQWINLLFFVFPNYSLVSLSCPRAKQHLTTGCEMIRWLCWSFMQWLAVVQAHNTNLWHRHHSSDPETGSIVKKPVIIGDLPFLKAHWWKILLWLPNELGVIAFTVYLLKVNGRQPIGIGENQVASCNGAEPGVDCDIGLVGTLLTLPLVIPPLISFALFTLFLVRGLQQQRYGSRMALKLADMIVRVQLRLRFPAFLFFAFSLILMFYVKPVSCTSIFSVWLGMLPGQISISVLVICIAYVGAPQISGSHKSPPLLQVWLQEFAWLEKDVERCRSVRSQSLAPQDLDQITKEPIFCVETMLKCLCWSSLVYEYKEASDVDLELKVACDLFNPPLEHYELIWERSLDTKCLLAWNSQAIMLSFRGTASVANVVSDLKAWHFLHWPRRGSWWNHSRVHSGFARAYLQKGLHRKILGRVESLLSSGSVQNRAHLTITGHSLGGALGTLASYDFASLPLIKKADVKVTCITFGAPRTGNRQFSKEFQVMVPDSWNVINGQDIFGRGFKLLWFYKRGGHRVIINSKGDFIVRPSPVEASLRLQPFSQSVKAHLLSSYMKSTVAVILRQFATGSRGSMLQVLELIQRNKMLEEAITRTCKLSLKDLTNAASSGKGLLVRPSGRGGPLFSRSGYIIES